MPNCVLDTATTKTISIQITAWNAEGGIVRLVDSDLPENDVYSHPRISCVIRKLRSQFPSAVRFTMDVAF